MTATMKVTNLQNESSATPNIVLNADGTTTIPTQSTTNLSYTGTLTGGTGVINIGSGQVYKDTAGNLGLGVTPSAWSTTNRKVFQIGAGSSGTVHFAGSSINSIFSSNYYFDGTNSIYQNNGFAQFYGQLSDGSHRFYTAPSGTAGNAISFTQAMTLDASGRLNLGQTANVNGFRFEMAGSGGASGDLCFDTNASYTEIQSFTSKPLYLNRQGNNVIINATAGDLFVGRTAKGYSSKLAVNGGIETYSQQFNMVGASGATFEWVLRTGSTQSFYVNNASVVATLSTTGVWTNASDARYKENIVESGYGLSTVMALKPRAYNLIGQADKPQIGFIAQEVLDILPEVVDSTYNSITEEDRYTLSYGQMSAVLVKAIQEQQAIIMKLQADVAALKGAA